MPVGLIDVAPPIREDVLLHDGDLLTRVAGEPAGISRADLAADPAFGAAVGTTNLTYTPSPTNGIVVSDTGTDATLPLATGTNAGLLTPAGFTKLTGIASATASAEGLVELATTGEATTGTDTTRAVTPAGLKAAIDALISGAPGALDTLNEISAALGNDANFAASMTTSLAGKQPLHAQLTALAALTSAANKLPYATGTNAWSLTDLTAFARTILDDADATAVKTTLGLVIGTDVQAQNANLAALAGLTGAADKAPYFTGAGAVALHDLSPFARTILDDADAATVRGTLGLVIGTNIQAFDADLSAFAALTSAADKMPYSTGPQTWALTDITAAGRSVVGGANIAAIMLLLGRATCKQSSTLSISSSTLADAAGMAFAVTANVRYLFRMTIEFTSADITVGFKVNFTGPALTSGQYAIHTALARPGSTTAEWAGQQPMYTQHVTPSVGVVATPYLIEITGSFEPSASGTIQLQVANETGVTASSAAAGAGELVSVG